MEKLPYHSYLFFHVNHAFYQQPASLRAKQKKEFTTLLGSSPALRVWTYASLGFKPDTTFMLWCMAERPEGSQDLLRGIVRSEYGQWLRVTHSYFGIVRDSTYSGRTGKPEQVIQNFEERLPYFILYPFIKTTDWYMMDFENRKAIMGQHIKTGLAYPDIRQCLLYSFGVDNQEFLVSYETPSLERFQDLVMQMRSTVGRKYTLSDIPLFTSVYKQLSDFTEWL